MIYGERLRELGICSLEQRRAREDMTAVFNYVKVNYVEEEANLFTAALETRTRSNGFKLQERKFHLNSWKHFLMKGLFIDGICCLGGRWSRLR